MPRAPEKPTPARIYGKKGEDHGVVEMGVLVMIILSAEEVKPPQPLMVPYKVSNHPLDVFGNVATLPILQIEEIAEVKKVERKAYEAG